MRYSRIAVTSLSSIAAKHCLEWSPFSPLERWLRGIAEELAGARRVRDLAAVINRSKPNLARALESRFAPLEAKALTVKILNILLARRHFDNRDSRLLSQPIGLIVDPSNTCQLACPGCVHSDSAAPLFVWPNATLAESTFAGLLKQYGTAAVGVYFCDYGEPLLNLRTPALIRMAKRRLITAGLSTSLSVRRFDAEAYVESGLDFMILSIDGATQSVYQRFRRNGDLSRVLGNVERLVAAKRQLGSATPVLSWNFLAFEHNRHEIGKAERMARELGVDRFRVVRPFDIGWDDLSIRAANVRPRVKRLTWTFADNWNPFPRELAADDIESAFDARFEAEDGTPLTSPGHTCHWLYKNLIMDAAGRIMPCCGAPGHDGGLVFARAGEVDPFNSPLYREARRYFTGAPAPDVHCSRCVWDHTTVNIGGREIRAYFRGAGRASFNRGLLRLLSDW